MKLIDLHTVAVVIPTYNEKENIVKLISQIRTDVGNAKIFVVDDNSPDGTEKFVRDYMKKHPRNLSLLTRKSKSGRGGAVITGFAEAMKDHKIMYFIEMDADFSHNPKAINGMLDKRGANKVVVASRYVRGSDIVGWPVKRWIASKLANSYIRMILGVPVHDCTNGYRCYSRQAVQIILSANVQHKGFITLSETLYLLFQKGFSFVEVPFHFIDRLEGKSNANFREIVGSFPAIHRIKMKY